MKELVILSGKGGTGKTSIAGCFAVLAENKVLCDCDVDAADLHLLLQPESTESHEFRSGQTAFIDPERCSKCGLCQESCRFDAIHDFVVDEASCEGCGFCSHICPDEAIDMKENLAGYWFNSATKFGPLVHARLGIAEENSGKLVTTVRNEARRIAEERGLDRIITDGPPGIGCPVISSLSGANMALIVTEPTLSGIHDLERVMSVCNHFKVPTLVCINKYDINEENSREIESRCQELGGQLAARIPFDNTVTEALVHGVPVIEYSQGEASEQIRYLWEAVLESLMS